MVRADKLASVYTYAYNGNGLLVSETIDGVETAFTWDLCLARRPAKRVGVGWGVAQPAR